MLRHVPEYFARVDVLEIGAPALSFSAVIPFGFEVPDE